MDLDQPIVVTGSAGFVGSALVSDLRGRGLENVIGIDIVDSPTTDVLADYGESSNVSDVIPWGARVVHLGGITTTGSASADPLRAIENNCLSTVRFADGCRRAGVAQFVFASSEWVYGDYEDEIVLSEDTPLEILENTSLYAQSKLAAEGFLSSTRFFENLMVLRFAIVYGPRPHPSSAPESILADCASNRRVVVGNPDTARRFIYIDDLIDGIVASLGYSGTMTLNMVGPQLCSLREVYRVASAVTGVSPEFLAEGQLPPSIRNVSGERAEEYLGWKAPTDLAEGLRRVLAGPV